MKQIFLIISIFFALNLFGQNPDIKNLIDQIADCEVPENFEYYFLVPESLEKPKIYDSLQNYQIRELKMIDKNFPVNLIYEKSDKTLNWSNYDFKNVKYVPDERIQQTSPPTSKKVRFVKYNIEQKEYDSLTKNREPHTLIVRKKWFWNKNKIWDNDKFHAELKKAWRIDRESNIEEKVYFQFSKPIFSKDSKYARVSVFKNWRCKGRGFTALYKNDDGNWKKLIEFNGIARQVSMTHSSCEDISIWFDE
ncbi:hypothetical protein [uncultured Marixanthomonas sp.]|uniref:hypothetical protein n=1 Tax=uncultured Marixanthomonas sp. TaxID=757245 RepID=UPI0030D931EA|tara:strand:- start:55 stop:804 length:750 start_codon:yes stop_codon:yes gene_type:complete